MTETKPTTDPLHPAQILLAVLLSLLTPLFLTECSGDTELARATAMDAISAYRARHQADLLAISQIIAFGVAALSSLNLSNAPDVPLPLVVRLRANAVALNRAAEQNRRTLYNHGRRTGPEPTADIPFGPAELAFEAAALAKLAEAQKLMAAAQAEPAPMSPPPAAPAPIAPAPIAAAPTPAVQTPAVQKPDVIETLEAAKALASTMSPDQWQKMLGQAMTRVAATCTADLAKLSPAERRHANISADALSQCATELMSGQVPPPESDSYASFWPQRKA